ncbi:hypothetical protein RBG15_003243 [Vibrio metoecus]
MATIRVAAFLCVVFALHVPLPFFLLILVIPTEGYRFGIHQLLGVTYSECAFFGLSEL